MGTIRLLMILALCALTGAQAQDHESARSKWLRRGLTGLACGLSAIDGYQSAKYLDGHHGLREGNGLLANPDGSINVPRMAGLKGLACGANIFVGELLPSKDRWSVTAVSGVESGLYTWVTIHNQQLIDHVKPGQVR